VLDVSDPSHPAEWGYADSYPRSSGGYNGVWECYPYFPSGTVDRERHEHGALRVPGVRNFGVVYARVKEAESVERRQVYVQTAGDSALTGAARHGGVRASPGACTIVGGKFGYQDATTNLTVGIGDHTTVNLTLVALPTTTFTGAWSTRAPLAGSERRRGECRLHAAPRSHRPVGRLDEGTCRWGLSYRDRTPPAYVDRVREEPRPAAETQTSARAAALRFSSRRTRWVVGAPGGQRGHRRVGARRGARHEHWRTQPVDVTARRGTTP